MKPSSGQWGARQWYCPIAIKTVIHMESIKVLIQPSHPTSANVLPRKPPKRNKKVFARSRSLPRELERNAAQPPSPTRGSGAAGADVSGRPSVPRGREIGAGWCPSPLAKMPPTATLPQKECLGDVPGLVTLSLTYPGGPSPEWRRRGLDLCAHSFFKRGNRARATATRSTAPRRL